MVVGVSVVGFSTVEVGFSTVVVGFSIVVVGSSTEVVGLSALVVSGNVEIISVVLVGFSIDVVSSGIVEVISMISVVVSAVVAIDSAAVVVKSTMLEDVSRTVVVASSNAADVVRVSDGIALVSTCTVVDPSVYVNFVIFYSFFHYVQCIYTKSQSYLTTNSSSEKQRRYRSVVRSYYSIYILQKNTHSLRRILKKDYQHPSSNATKIDSNQENLVYRGNFYCRK